MAEQSNLTACQTHHLWHYIHRPEEYTNDLMSCLAADLRLPNALLTPLLPFINRILRKWDDAAEETTEYIVYEDGTRLLRTVFLITVYPPSLRLNLIGRILRILGVGRTLKADPNTEFGWLLIGNILTNYARRAGIRPATVQKLLEFRLHNSDYFTLTSWFTDCVEIENLKTGKVERLCLEDSEIAKIVDYALHYQKNLRCKKTRPLAPNCPEWEKFYTAVQHYELMKSSQPQQLYSS
ncbi:MAG: hypothetical protein AB1546_11170 [bacterium]